jgi:hypothetical protein
VTIDPREVPSAAQIEALRRIHLTMVTFPTKHQFTIIAEIVLTALAQAQKEAQR